jgi:hypothetical protein
MEIKTFDTAEDAQTYRSTLLNENAKSKHAEEEAKRNRQESADSWERSDTDGCLTQVCCGITARLYDMKADIEAHNGTDIFPVLVDVNTNEIVSTKLFIMVDRFAPWKSVDKWVTKAGQWITNYSNEKNFVKKGVVKKYAVLPAKVGYRHPLDKRPELKGTGNLHTVRAVSFPNWDIIGFGA